MGTPCGRVCHSSQCLQHTFHHKNGVSGYYGSTFQETNRTIFNDVVGIQSFVDINIMEDWSKNRETNTEFLASITETNNTWEDLMVGKVLLVVE